MGEGEDPSPQCVLACIGKAFDLPGELIQSCGYGNGHVNDTFLATYRDESAPGGRRRYIHQRLATVFRDPPTLMTSIERVTAHLASRAGSGSGSGSGAWAGAGAGSGAGAGATQDAGPSRHVLHLLHTPDGAPYTVDKEGRTWRTYDFIEGSHSLEIATTPLEVERAARAFGSFLARLSDLPEPRLPETIEHFHDLGWRWKQLVAALDHSERRRLARAKEALDSALGLHGLVTAWQTLARQAAFPVRPTHNDCKLNNILFDNSTGQPLCVIDLDTVMPGWAICDFGDLVRTTVSSGTEDATSLAAMHAEAVRLEAAAIGFTYECGNMLTSNEKEHLVFGAQAMTFEVGIRFLTDYLSGDVYFHTERPEQNLDRARAQLALAEDLVDRQPELEARLARHL